MPNGRQSLMALFIIRGLHFQMFATQDHYISRKSCSGHVTVKDEESHLRSLEEVFGRLEKHNFRLKQETCTCRFLLPAVEYLGHHISKEGVSVLPSKVEAIVKAPTNVTQL